MQNRSYAKHRRGVTYENVPRAEVAVMMWGDKPVYLACGHTDMRKQINGLAAIVEAGFKLDPFCKALYVFCNRNRDRIKILEWGGDGFWLYFKRLERGRFRWPGEGDTPTMVLTSDELNLLLGSPRIIQKLKRQEIKPGPTI